MDPDQFADGSSLIRAHRICCLKCNYKNVKYAPNVKCIYAFSVYLLVGYGIE